MISWSGRERASRELSSSELAAAISTGTVALEKLTAAAAEGTAQPTAADPVNGSPIDRAALKKRLRKLEVEIYPRTSLPCAAFLLALMGLPLGIQPPRTQRTWGLGFSVVLGLAVFIAYFSLLSTGTALAESGRWSPIIGLWLPNLLTLLAAWLIVGRVGSERWHSIAQACEECLRPFWSRFLGRQRA